MQGLRLTVAEVLSSWRTPDGKAFRVRTETDEVFELYYHEMDDNWVISQP